MITTPFCTCHDSCSVMACAKWCCDVITRNGVMVKKIFMEFDLWWQKLIVKWLHGRFMIVLKWEIGCSIIGDINDHLWSYRKTILCSQWRNMSNIMKYRQAPYIMRFMLPFELIYSQYALIHAPAWWSGNWLNHSSLNWHQHIISQRTTSRLILWLLMLWHN